MKEITLPVEVRMQQKKKVGKLRREGFIPGIYYLHGEGNVPIKVREKQLLPIIRSSETHILNLDFSPGGSKQGIIRDVQYDPVSDKPLHIDLQGVRADEELTLQVPISLVGGTPAGVRMGGILQHILHSIEISCLPKYIPEHIEINISELAMNHSIHVSDIKLENVRILTHGGDPIVSVLPPLVEKAASAEGTEEAKEVEVIGKGKKEEEGTEPSAESGKAPAKSATKEEKKK